MAAQDTLNLFADEQGWNDHSKITLCLRYIDSLGDYGLKEFGKFLKEQADEENNADESPRFKVHEWFNGFELEDTTTGRRHWLSDGVDCVFDSDGDALAPGGEEFCILWAEQFNADVGSTLEAYFHDDEDDEEEREEDEAEEEG